MASYIKSKVQQSLSFLLVLVIAFSVFSGVLFLNPSPSYAFDEATLSQALTGDKNLFEANLIGANLIGANLRRANLRRANLRRANLRGARLSGADLIGADLIGADLRGADLIGADLRGADLSWAMADRLTQFPAGFDAVGAGVEFRD
jgi:uncharacterized protein YjbI with pentapeptide repeats